VRLCVKTLEIVNSMAGELAYLTLYISNLKKVLCTHIRVCSHQHSYGFILTVCVVKLTVVFQFLLCITLFNLC